MVTNISTHKIANNPVWYKTLTLTERLASLRAQAAEAQMSAFDPAQAERKLRAWKAQHPFEKASTFAERLALDDLEEENLLRLLGETNDTGQGRMQDIPDWLGELERAFEQAASSETPDDPLSLDRANEILREIHPQYTDSFLVAIVPLISRATERLKAGLATLTAMHAVLPFDPETIHRVFLVNLVGQLLPQISRVLTLELHVARMEERLSGETSEERFRSFLQQLSRTETMLALLEEYAPLARLLMGTIDHWVHYSLEFMQHLCADWDEIRQTLSPESDPGTLVEVTGGIGDLHKQGRSTLKLRFSSGFQLMYKPRSLAIDVHFQRLLAWLNARGDHPAFRLIQIIDKGPYGWSEFVLSQDCSSAEEVARFYERQGGYLALFYALEGTDMHHENLIASGEHPVMTDLEALFHPDLGNLILAGAQAVTHETMRASVLRVGLLPRRMWGNQEQAGVDISGLGGKGGQRSPRPVLQVEAYKTDQMRYIRQHVQMPEQKNRPTLRGESAETLDYSDQFIQGFSKVYRLLMLHREALLVGPLQAFAQDTIRVIVRPTRTYAQLLSESYHPDLLHDMLERDRFFDRLWAEIEHQPSLKRLIAAERADLHAGDIPMFTARPDTRDIFTSQGVCIPCFLAEPSLELVKRRLQGLSEADLARQLWFIQASFATIPMGSGHLSYTSSRLAPAKTKATSERLIQAACAVGDRLAERALLSERGANWLGLTFIHEREWMLLPASIDLYSGGAGIAFFLAYLGAITGAEKYTALAQRACTSVQEQVKELRDSLMSVGGFSGWGGVLYLYAHLGVLWQDNTLLAEAADLVRVLPDLIAKDQALDVINGSAGCISGLLSLYQVLPSAHILEAALQCGDRLLTQAPQCGADLHAIAQIGDTPAARSRPLAGFSHGAAGMALSLLKLAAVSEQERFRQGAIAAMTYERQVFSPERQNWPDLRDLEEMRNAPGNSSERKDPPFMVAWCHGAPGIGLGRLASLPYFEDGVMHEEIAIALQTTLAQGFGWNHSLCHGDLGDLETLLTAAQVLDDAEYQAHRERLAAMLLESIETYGWLTGIPLGVETPGLMTGLAGIGYELLRLAAPERVPCLLALEEPGNRVLKSAKERVLLTSAKVTKPT